MFIFLRLYKHTYLRRFVHNDFDIKLMRTSTFGRIRIIDLTRFLTSRTLHFKHTISFSVIDYASNLDQYISADRRPQTEFL